MKKIISFLILNSSFLIFNFLSAQTYNLEDLKSQLRQNNTDVRTAEEEYKRSVLDYKDAVAGLGPQIDFSLSGTFMANPPIGAIDVNVDDIIDKVWDSVEDSVNGAIGGIGGIGPITKPGKTNEKLRVYDGMDHTLFMLQISITQPIFAWGKIFTAKNLYKEISRIQEIKYENTITQAETELETRIVTLYYLTRLVRTIDEEKKYSDELITYSEEAEKNGMLLHQDLLEIKIKTKELDMARQNILEEIKNQMIEIQRITGIEDLTFDQIVYKYDEKILAPYFSETFDQTEAMNKALSGDRPSIKMVTQAKVVSGMATKIAKNSVYWKPDVGLQASIGYGGFAFPIIQNDWTDKDKYSLNISLGIKTTIWDGGKKLNNIKRNQSNEESAQINADIARAKIRQTMQEQFNIIDFANIKIDYQKLKIEVAESKIKQQQLLHDSGYGSRTDLLSARIDKCNEEIELIQNELKRTVAGLTIKFLMGE